MPAAPDPEWLAVAVAAVSVSLLALCLCASLLEQNLALRGLQHAAAKGMDVRFAAVFDVDPSRAEAFAERKGATLAAQAGVFGDIPAGETWSGYPARPHREALLSIPTPDHYLPLLYVIGTRQASDSMTFPVEGVDGGSISMLSVQVGEAKK